LAGALDHLAAQPDDLAVKLDDRCGPGDGRAPRGFAPGALAEELSPKLSFP